jgi:lipase
MQSDPRHHVFTHDGVSLHWFEWGERKGQTVLLVHATGFHARCWDQVVAALPAGQHVVAIDMRGHGRSDKIPPYNWAAFGADLEAFVRFLGLHGAIGVGHSMGGHCVAHVAARVPDAFARLLLVDPVIMSPEAYAAARHQNFASPADHPVARRRSRWSSWQEMQERFQDRTPFSRWRPEVLVDYCRFGLLPEGDEWVLACPGEVEATIYMGSARTEIHDDIRRVAVPVTVLRAPGRDPGDTNVMDFSKSPTWPALAAQFPDGRDVFLPDHSHFIPMEDPTLVARFICEAKATP